MKKQENYLRRLLEMFLPYKWNLLLILFLLILSTGFGFLQPLTIQQITDTGMLQRDINVVIQYACALGLLVLFAQIIEITITRLFADIHNSLYASIFNRAFDKLLHLRKSYFEDKNSAEVLSFLQMDVSQVSSLADQYSATCVGHIFRMISGLVGLCLISWKLALVVITMVPIKYLLVRSLSRRQEQVMSNVLESSRDFSRWFSDELNGIDEVKLWNLFQKQETIFQEKQKKILHGQKQITMIGGWNFFGESLLEWGVTIILYIIGGFLVCSDTLSIGSVFAFISYSGYVTGPVSALLNLKMHLARIVPSSRRLFNFMSMETEPDKGTTFLMTSSPVLEFQNVDFYYDNTRKVLQNITFTIKPGKKIAVIGQNGSGKSTLIKLLLRFYLPSSGTIRINGLDIQNIPLAEYRNLFSVVSQNPYLFMGNIIDNIDLYGNSDENKVHHALHVSGVESYLSRMPQLEKTLIGQNGARLSGGERQKIAVARAILKDSSVVVLDEATSGFDVESNAYLHDIIVNHMKNKTVIMITHHYQNLEGMDEVWKLEDGKLSLLDNPI